MLKRARMALDVGQRLADDAVQANLHRRRKRLIAADHHYAEGRRASAGACQRLNGLHLNPEINMCDWPQNANCQAVR